MFWKVFNPWGNNFKESWRFKAFWAVRLVVLIIPIMTILASIGCLTDKDTSGGWGFFVISCVPYALSISYVWAIDDFHW